MRECHTAMEVGQMSGAMRGLRRLDTDFVGKSVDGLWGWAGDLVVKGCDDLCGS